MRRLHAARQREIRVAGPSKGGDWDFPGSLRPSCAARAGARARPFSSRSSAILALQLDGVGSAGSFPGKRGKR